MLSVAKIDAIIAQAFSTRETDFSLYAETVL